MKKQVIKESPKSDPSKHPNAVNHSVRRESAGGEVAGGYSYHFVASPPELVKCVICHLPSKNPHLSECCGHIFCATCLQQCKITPNVERVCPMCKDSSFNTIPNKQIDREVRSLQIHCKNKAKGCTWQGEVNDISKHLKNSDGCQYEDVKCTYKCRKRIQRQYLMDHITSKCPRRKVNCQYCHINGEFKFIEGEHREECNKFPLSCPNKCEVGSIPREDMEAHRKECPLEMIQCEYHNVGCDVRMARKRKHSHLEENMGSHLHMTKLKLAKTEDKLLSTEKRVDNLEKMWIRLLQTNTESNSTTPAINWASQLETSALTVPNQTCPIFIKLPQLASHLKSGNVWYSEPFYIDKDGYRMRLYTKTNDDNSGVAVGLHLMKGPHDDKLPWPLRRKFEIKLMNQISDSEHQSGTLIFNEKADKAAGRVIDESNTIQGLVIRNFISLATLRNVTETHQFYKNDCIFFLIQSYNIA